MQLQIREEVDDVENGNMGTLEKRGGVGGNTDVRMGVGKISLHYNTTNINLSRKPAEN